MLLTAACPSSIQRPFAFARTGGALLRRRVSREVADPAVAGPFPSTSPLPSSKFWGYAKKRAFTLIRADLDTSADVIGANLARKRRFLLLFLADAPRTRQACVWKKRGNAEEATLKRILFYPRFKCNTRRRVATIQVCDAGNS